MPPALEHVVLRSFKEQLLLDLTWMSCHSSISEEEAVAELLGLARALQRLSAGQGTRQLLLILQYMAHWRATPLLLQRSQIAAAVVPLRQVWFLVECHIPGERLRQLTDTHAHAQQGHTELLAQCSSQSVQANSILTLNPYGLLQVAMRV